MILAPPLYACAPNVDPVTIDVIIQHESAGNLFALHVNAPWTAAQPRASSVEEAAAITRKFVAAGYNVDLGLMQINSRNLSALGYTIEEMFEPCKNVAGGGAILTNFYGKALGSYQDGQPALHAALSAYATGSFVRGQWFVGELLVIAAKGPHVPLVQGSGGSLPPSRSFLLSQPTMPPDPYTADTIVFQRVGLNVAIN